MAPQVAIRVGMTALRELQVILQVISSRARVSVGVSQNRERQAVFGYHCMCFPTHQHENPLSAGILDANSNNDSIAANRVVFLRSDLLQDRRFDSLGLIQCWTVGP